MKEEKAKEVTQEEFDKFVKKFLNFDAREKKVQEGKGNINDKKNKKAD